MKLMPIYDFHCRSCGHEFEALVRGQDGPACPSCRGGDLERLLSNFAVSSEERRQAAVKSARKRAIAANRDKVIAEEEYRRQHEH